MAALPGLVTRPEDEQRRLHLTAHLALHDRPETHRLFVLIDQFEEIFTLCNDETARRLLIENVLYATSVAEGRTIVVLTIRADFYGQCASYAGLRAAISDRQSLIGPLSDEELRQAIVSPAELASADLEPGLVELLLADMKGHAGALPFLEHALFKLWERRDGRRLTVKDYTEMGHIGGALDLHAEEFFTKILTTEEQRLCREILVDLVRPGEGAADTKRRVALDDVAPTNAARAVLKKLADARLVITGRDDRPEVAQAELAHEALISGWRRLGNWVNESREKSRLKERLLDSAREWQKSGNRADFLYRGAQLAAAAETFFAGSLPKVGEEFLEVSLADECRERNERELQQKREVASLVTVAQTERRRAEVERKARQRQRYSIAALVGLVVAATLVAAISVWEGVSALNAEKEASEQKAEAKKQAELALSAQAKADEQKAEAEKQAELALSAQAKAEEQADLARIAEAEAREQKGEAEKKTRLAIDAEAELARIAQERTDDAVSQAKVSLARYSREAGNDAKALAHLAEALRLNQKNHVAAALAGAMLTQTSWPIPIVGTMQHDPAMYFAKFSPDGQRMVTASSDGTVRLCDALSGKAIGEPMRHERQVRSAWFSLDGQRVVTASDDGTARLWDTLTGQAIGEPMKHGGRVTSAQFSPDGKRVATASDNGMARLWDTLTGQAIGQPMKHAGPVQSAQFSPDSQRVVTASDDGTARLWNATSGEAIGEPMEHGHAVNSAQFSPDGQWVLTASDDGTARLWDVANGKPVGESIRHERQVRSALFSLDGQAGSNRVGRWDSAALGCFNRPSSRRADEAWWPGSISPVQSGRPAGGDCLRRRNGAALERNKRRTDQRADES
jgi:hypothetical protein